MDFEDQPALLEDIYTRGQIAEFLEKISPKKLLELEKIYLTCNPIDPNMGRKIRFIGKQLPNSWNNEWEPCRNGIDPTKFVQNMKIECARVQDHYVRNLDRFEDVHTVEGQKRLAEETGTMGSSFILHYYNPNGAIGTTLAKGWIALAKALNNGNFTLDSVISLSFARFGVNDEKSRLKVRANCPVTVEMMREIEKITKEQRLRYSIKVKTDVASYLTWWVNENGKEFIRFESPLKGKVSKIDDLAARFGSLNV